MTKNKVSMQRVDEDFVKDMRTLAKMRYFKNLAKKEPSLKEMTALLRRTQGWGISTEELKNKPKKE